MESLQIQETEIKPGIMQITFSGSLDTSQQASILELEHSITKYPSQTKVLFNFANLVYLNSFAIGFIAHWYNLLRKNESIIVIVSPQPQVFDVLHVLGLTEVFKIVDSVDEALKIT